MKVFNVFHGCSVAEGSQRPHLYHGAVVIELPFDVQFFDADATGVDAGQQDVTTVHRLQKGDLTSVHLQCLQCTIHTLERGKIRANQVECPSNTEKDHHYYRLVKLLIAFLFAIVFPVYFAYIMSCK